MKTTRSIRSAVFAVSCVVFALSSVGSNARADEATPKECVTPLGEAFACNNAELARCISSGDTGFNCSDANKAARAKSILLDGEKIDLDNIGGVRGALLAISSASTISECEETTKATCKDRKHTDIDFVRFYSASECRKMGKLLSFRKWQIARREGRKLMVSWNCE